MTNTEQFYLGIAPRTKSDGTKVENRNYSFDEISGMLGDEDQLVGVVGLDPFDGVELSGAELAAGTRVFHNQLVYPTQFTARPFDGLARARFAAYVQALYSARKILPGPIGLGGQGSNIIPGMIRPSTAYANGGTNVATWVPANPAAAWTAAYWTLNMNKSSTTKTINTQNNCALIVLGFGDADASPNLFEVEYVDDASTKYGVRSLAFTGFLGDTQVAMLDQAFYVGINRTWTVDASFIRAGTSTPAIIGFQIPTRVLATAEAT